MYPPGWQTARQLPIRVTAYVSKSFRHSRNH